MNTWRIAVLSVFWLAFVSLTIGGVAQASRTELRRDGNRMVIRFIVDKAEVDDILTSNAVVGKYKIDMLAVKFANRYFDETLKYCGFKLSVAANTSFFAAKTIVSAKINYELHKIILSRQGDWGFYLEFKPPIDHVCIAYNTVANTEFLMTLGGAETAMAIVNELGQALLGSVFEAVITPPQKDHPWRK